MKQGSCTYFDSREDRRDPGRVSIVNPIGYRDVTNETTYRHPLIHVSARLRSGEATVPRSYRYSMRTTHDGDPVTRSAVDHGRGKLLRHLDRIVPQELETHPLLKASGLGTFNALLHQQRKAAGVGMAEY